MKKVELLSPAGDYESFIGAISGGCDAVYLSGEKYGARAYAKNFSEAEVIKAIETAHLYNKKVYLTVNTLFKCDETDGLYDYLLPYYKAGLDSVIVQDIGVISYIGRHFPELNIHASTQLAITSYEGIKLLNKLNVKRCVLARELSLNEIKTIREHDKMELECFVHGALCYSYSGKCLLSSLIGGRSGNRGRCAGSCRQPYNDKYLLSTKDICCLEILPELISAGIASFKIEGRMKSPEYVYGVTAMYRKYIDLYYANIGDTDVSDSVSLAVVSDIKESIFSGKEFKSDLATLERLYTRGGNSTGYYYQHNGRDMVSIEDASYKTGYDKQDENENGVGNGGVQAMSKLRITGSVSVRTGQPTSLTLKYGNAEVTVNGAVAEKAGSRPIDEATVKKQLLKTGDTVFEFEKIEFDISDDAFVRIGDLNELRRTGLAALKDKVLESTRKSALPEDEKAVTAEAVGNAVTIEASETVRAGGAAAGQCVFSADVCTKEQLRACVLNERIKRIYVPYSLAEEMGRARNAADGADKSDFAGVVDKQVYIKFPSVIRHSFIEKNADDILRIANAADGVLIDNNELLYFFKENGYDKPITADIHLYCLNREAESKYRELGITNFTVPVELNKHELSTRGMTGETLIVYGYLPMMISAQCVNNTLNGCNKKQTEIKLKDRKNASFTCVNDCDSCTNIIYNSVPLSLHNESEFIEQIKPESIKLNFTTEDAGLTETVIDYFTGGFYGNEPPYKYFTKGHLNRGVL